jgi:hypothetical protein
MTLPLSIEHRGTTLRPALLAVLGELALTSIHHGYGAVIYAAPFRFQVVVISAVLAVLILGLAYVAANHRGSMLGGIAWWLNVLIIVAYPIVAIGLVEGGYNHIVKNVIYLLGNRAVYDGMFPASAYELPTDWFFELTGIAQFPVGVAAAWLGIAAWRGR